MFCIPKSTLVRVAYFFFEDSYRTSQDSILIGADFSPTSEVRESVMLLLLFINKRPEVAVSSNGITFITNFVKICQVVHKLKGNIHSMMLS